MIRPLFPAALAAVVLVLPATADAQTGGSQVQRVRSVTLKPGQKCPPSTATDIVVCGTLDQPYRIPKGLRDDGPIPAQRQSWANRTATADDVQRVAGGLPDTCSPVGSGGQTGCALAANRQWAAEKRAQRDAAAVTP